VIVWLFDSFVHGPSVIAYAIAAVIGVPVTFVFMKIFTFEKEKQ
jgi:putative flippase GtrA